MMKILIDDTCFCIDEIDGPIDRSYELFKTNSYWKLKSFTEIILTPTQLERFMENDTKRIFTVSDKKLKEAQEYMLNLKS